MIRFLRVLFVVLFAVAGFSQTSIADKTSPPPVLYESDFSTAWCLDNGGKREYALPDQTRVDCWIPSRHWAVEVERISKPYEAVGQALFYAAAVSQMTKKPAVPVAVFFDDGGDMVRFKRYFRRFKLATAELEFIVFCFDMRGNSFACPE